MTVSIEGADLSSSILPPLPIGTIRWLPSLTGGKRRIASLLGDARSADVVDGRAALEEPT